MLLLESFFKSFPYFIFSTKQCAFFKFSHMNYLLSSHGRWFDEYQDDGRTERELSADSGYSAGEVESVALWGQRSMPSEGCYPMVVVSLPFPYTEANTWGGSACLTHILCF